MEWLYSLPEWLQWAIHCVSTGFLMGVVFTVLGGGNPLNPKESGLIIYFTLIGVIIAVLSIGLNAAATA